MLIFSQCMYRLFKITKYSLSLQTTTLVKSQPSLHKHVISQLLAKCYTVHSSLFFKACATRTDASTAELDRCARSFLAILPAVEKCRSDSAEEAGITKRDRKVSKRQPGSGLSSDFLATYIYTMLIKLIVCLQFFTTLNKNPGQTAGSGLWPMTRPDPAPNPGPNDPLTRFHLCFTLLR